jgi:hypothetical protein
MAVAAPHTAVNAATGGRILVRALLGCSTVIVLPAFP